MKTNKSYSKRLKLTRNGKIIARKPGQNHYNARERTKTSVSKKQNQSISMPNKAKSRYLVNM